MNIKKCFLLLCCLTFFNAFVFGQSQGNKFKLVIDAGHGGEDPGCRGKKSQEKTVTLNVALKLGKLISDNFDDVQVIYTRKTDVFVEVYKRAVIANNNHADLFISIHCNAAENKAAHGVETWVMGLAKSDANMEVAKKENAAILKEKNFENNYEGFNPNSPEANVIFSLHTSAYMNHSIMLADKVQRNLVHNTHLLDRTVKQAGFWVLYKVAMPSILIELGFLSNATEEEYMLKPNSQEIMAVSIYNAFVEYRNALDGGQRKPLPLPAASENVNDNVSVTSQSVDPDVAPDPSVGKVTVDDGVASEPTTARATATPAPTSSTSSSTSGNPSSTTPAVPAGSASTASTGTSQTTTASTSSSADNAGTSASSTGSASSGTGQATTASTNSSSAGSAGTSTSTSSASSGAGQATTASTSSTSTSSIRFRVQIAAVPENIPVTDSRFRMVKDVRKFKEGKFWKYTCGNATTLEEAKEILQKAKPYFQDAFVIAFDGETKIPVSQALEKLK